MTTRFAPGEVVWALKHKKLWWPARIVSEATGEPGLKFKVRYIGRKAGAVLKLKALRQYDDDSRNTHWSSRFSDAVDTANSLLRKPRLRATHRDSLMQEVEGLTQELEAKAAAVQLIPGEGSEEMYAQLASVSQSLRGFTHHYLCKSFPSRLASYPQLMKCITKLVQSGLSLNTLQSSGILRTLKIFVEEFKERGNKTLRETARLAEKLVLVWKLMMTEDAVANLQY